MTNKAEPILTAGDLHKAYRIGHEQLHILRGVSLAVQQGEWICILGASGSGKSTLLHLLGALDRPDQGQVRFNGQDVLKLQGSDLDQYRNVHVGFVFQFHHLLPELNSLENVLIAAMTGSSALRWLGQRSKMRGEALDLLGQLGMSERLRHRPPKLSGGERQRVAIARALINRPDVLLADEPTGNLDADTGGQLLAVLKKFHKAGQSIVMVTHDSRVARFADRQFILNGGKLIPG